MITHILQILVNSCLKKWNFAIGNVNRIKKFLLNNKYLEVALIAQNKTKFNY